MIEIERIEFKLRQLQIQVNIEECEETNLSITVVYVISLCALITLFVGGEVNKFINCDN